MHNDYSQYLHNYIYINNKMAKTSSLMLVIFGSCYFIIASLLFQTVASSDEGKLCALLQEKYYESNFLSSYTLLFEPIKRGRLTVWSSSSTLPLCLFRCTPKITNSFDHETVVMRMGHHGTRIEWNYYDLQRDALLYGTSAMFSGNTSFTIDVSKKKSKSGKECNEISQIAVSEDFVRRGKDLRLQTSCLECTQSTINIINSQITQIIDEQLHDQIMNNFYWHIRQILTSNQWN